MGSPKVKREDARVMMGKKIRYIGVGGTLFRCSCGRTIKRGMVSEYQEQLYCSEDCIHDKQRLGV